MSERNLLVRFMLDALFQVGVIIFGSVRFLPIKTNQTELFFFKKQLKPSLTDRFRFGSVFNVKKPRK
jgi:hypothetical protein